MRTGTLVFNAVLVTSLGLVVLALSSSWVRAQTPCTTTLDCAQKAVDAAAKATAAVQVLQDKVDNFQKVIDGLPTAITNSFEFTVQASDLAPARNEARADCSSGGVIVGGSCIGYNGGTQVAIGPVYYDPVQAADGKPISTIRCQPYTSEAGMRVRAFAVCMRPKK